MLQDPGKKEIMREFKDIIRMQRGEAERSGKKLICQVYITGHGGIVGGNTVLIVNDPVKHIVPMDDLMRKFFTGGSVGLFFFDCSRLELPSI